ncbi:GFA family protein [Sorangium sp. So ce321]
MSRSDPGWSTRPRLAARWSSAIAPCAGARAAPRSPRTRRCTPARFISCKGRSSSPSTRRRRAFCSRCGSPLYSRMLDRPGIRRVRLGTLEEAPGARPVAHIWVSAKAAWDTLCDDGLERFDEAPPPYYGSPGPRR